jgi:Sensors of blue-light using FAD
MHKLIYASQTAHSFTDAELATILTSSRNNNTKAGLTGLLMYFAESFLQMIEGDRDSLTATYQRIEGDVRHRNLRLLAFAPANARRFSAWTMGFAHLDEVRLASELPGFRPESTYPLVSSDLITNATVAETLLTLYAKS